MTILPFLLLQADYIDIAFSQTLVDRLMGNTDGFCRRDDGRVCYPSDGDLARLGA